MGKRNVFKRHLSIYDVNLINLSVPPDTITQLILLKSGMRFNDKQ